LDPRKGREDDRGTEGHLAGASLGTVHVNPLAFGLSVGTALARTDGDTRIIGEIVTSRVPDLG
jgi:hypothetical protein